MGADSYSSSPPSGQHTIWYYVLMIKLVVFVSLLLLVGLGMLSCSEPTPPPDTPMMVKGEILALVTNWVKDSCKPNSFIYPYMNYGAFTADYAGDNIWKVGIMVNNKKVKVFSVYERSMLVKITATPSSGVCKPK